MAERTLPCEGESPEEIKILLTAPTGCAAYNIGGITLHSAFRLPIYRGKSYVRLSEDTRNTLRLKLSHLQILIIDEISMVGADVFLQVHRRLSEIMGNDKIFGGVSVLAVGDLYQLPPIGQQFVFGAPRDSIAHIQCPLWHEHFRMATLTKIMRQRGDAKFAKLLNRVRTGDQTDDDVKVLLQRQISPDTVDYPRTAQHVFAVNIKVDSYNIKMLTSLKQQVIRVKAIDKVPSLLKKFTPPNDLRHTGGLANEVELAHGARVMLTSNIYVTDGLVNGSQGTIVSFVNTMAFKKDPSTPPLAVLVQFDHDKVGTKVRSVSEYSMVTYPNATPIVPVEMKFKTYNGTRGFALIS